MAQFDLALPKFSEGDLDDAKQRRKIMNYLYKLDEQLRFVLNNLDAENFTETFQQVFVGGGGITSDGGSVRKLEDELAKLSTKIQQTASQIELKADAEELNELGDAVSQVESDLKVIAGKIESTVTRTEFDELGNKVSENTSLIEQTAAAIRSEVSDAESDLRSEISQTAADIRSEVENTESELRSEISQTAGSIRSEVSSSVSGLQSQINQTDGKIELAVGNVQVGGTNLAAFSKLSFFNAAGTLTGELAEHGEGRPHYCRSGKVVVLSPFSGDYDLAAFLNISLAAGKRYTVSFWAACDADNALLAVNIFNSGRGVDTNLGDIVQTKSNGGYYVRTFECPLTDIYELRFICFGGHAGTVNIMDAKLEEGTKATAWSPAPEDTDAEFAEVRSELSIEAGKIRSEVSSSVSGLQSQIDQTDGKIKLAVEDIQVGGTNLAAFSKLGFFNSAGTLTGELVERADGSAHYCRSGKVLVLSPFSGDYDGTVFLNISLAAGKRYTVSFWASCDVSDTPLYANIFNSGRGVDMNLGSAAQTGSNGGYYVRTFECPVTDVYELRFICFNGHAGTIHIMDVKLEEGTEATAWSPAPEDPVSSLKAGTNVLITKDQFSVTTPEFNVNITSPDGTENMLNIDENGIHAQSIDCPNVTPRYDGPGTLYVNPNATSAQIAAGTHYRSLVDACAAISGKNLDRDVVIDVQGDSYGSANLYGICGRGSLTVIGNSRNLTGELLIGRNTADIVVDGLTMTATGSAAVLQRGPGWMQWTRCRFIGNTSGGSYGLRIVRHAAAFMFECELYNAEHLLSVGVNSDVVCNMLQGGGGTNFLYGDGGIVKWYGTRPDGALRTDHPSLYAPADLAALTINYGTAQPSAPSTATVSYAMTNADNYVNGGWTNYSDDDIRQGYTSLGEHRGCFWFDNAAIRSALNGKTINQVTLSLYQMSGYGRNQPVQVNLEGITMEYSGRSGTPWGTQEYGVIGTTAGVNQTTTFTIPTKVVTDLVSGTINGLMLRTGETSVMSGQDNSYHFARFAGGTTTAYRPVLTVTYQS